MIRAFGTVKMVPFRYGLPLFATVLLALGVCGSSESSETSDQPVPVLMWGTALDAPKRSAPLERVSPEDFSRLVRDRLKRLPSRSPFTVVFVEETLSVEDLSSKDAKGRSPFPHLRDRISSGTYAYLPAVEGAVGALDSLAEPSEIDRVEMTERGLSADIPVTPCKFLFVRLRDAREGEDRFKMLYRHDRFINEMYHKLAEKYGDVLAIYTARYPSWEQPPETGRFRRQLLQSVEDAGGFYNASDMIYMYTPAIFLYEDDKKINLTEGVASLIGESNQNLTLDLKFTNGVSLQFVHENVMSYWSMTKVLVMRDGKEIAELKPNDVSAPVGFSYHCGQAVNYTHSNKSNTDIVLQIDELQIQPFFAFRGQGRFDSAYDCIGVMSVPIWSGIFLLAIVITILSGGITMMMNIRTMDRFDDPKGKTITINASE